MPLFNPQLSQADPSASAHVKRAVAPAATIATAAQGIQAVGEMAIEDQNKDIKATFQAQQDDISKQETIFSNKQQELNTSILSAKDSEEINDIWKSLQKLEAGQVSGALSREAADVRRKAILRTGLQRSPWLASELSALTASNRSTGPVEDSPEKKAVDTLREDAIAAGRDLSTQLKYSTYLADKEFAVKKTEVALNSGTISFPEYRNGFNSILDAQRINFMDKLVKQVRADPTSIDSTDWKATVENTRSEYRRLLQEGNAKAAKNGILFSDADQSRLEEDIKIAMLGIEQFAESKDKVKYLERQESFIKSQGLDILAKNNPFLSLLVSQGLEQTAERFMFDVMPRFTDIMKKSGNMDKIRLLAEGTSGTSSERRDAILFLQALEYNSQYNKEIHNKVQNGRDVNEGKLENVLINTHAVNWLAMPVPPSEKNSVYQSQVSNAVDRLIDPASSTKELRHFLRPEVRQNISKEDLSKINNRTDLLEVGLVSKLSSGTIIAGTDNSFLPSKQMTIKDLAFEPSKGFYFKGLPVGVPEPKSDVLFDLNTLYSLRKANNTLETDPTTWANSLLTKSKIPEPKEEVSPKPTEEKPPQAEKNNSLSEIQIDKIDMESMKAYQKVYGDSGQALSKLLRDERTVGQEDKIIKLWNLVQE